LFHRRAKLLRGWFDGEAAGAAVSTGLFGAIIRSMQTLSSTKRPSDRKFSFTFIVIVVAIGIYGLFAAWGPVVYWLCALAAYSGSS
jgi:hypothetical protein